MMPHSSLVDHRGPFADEARPYPVERLQIQLLIGLGWNKACRRPLHRLGYAMGISEIILVPLPKRLRIRRRHLLHIVAERGKFTSNIVWALHLNFEGGDQRILRINDDVSRFSLNFKADRKLHLCSPLSTFDR
jgi:hypothetical protein